MHIGRSVFFKVDSYSYEILSIIGINENCPKSIICNSQSDLKEVSLFIFHQEYFAAPVPCYRYRPQI